MSAYDRKYKSATAMVIRCPMFITCQTDMDFGDEHNEAMAVRLRKFHFKRLNTTTVAGVQQSLKEHAMDCLVWASSKAETPEDELPLQIATRSSRKQAINAEEKERIRTLNLDEEESGDTSPPRQAVDLEDSEEGSDEEATGSSDFWQRELNKISEMQAQEPKHSLRQRQLALIGGEIRRVAEESQKGLEERKQALLEDTRRRWVALGMIEEDDAHLLTSAQGPFHQNIEKSREKYFARKKKEEEEMRRQKAKEAYENVWVQNTEKELHDCVFWLNSTIIDDEHRTALATQRDLLCDKLKTHHTNLGLVKCDEALEERRRKCVAMGLLEECHKNLVRSVYEALPVFDDPAGNSEEDEEIFMTPVSKESSANANKRVAVSPSYSTRETSKTIPDYFMRTLNTQ